MPDKEEHRRECREQAAFPLVYRVTGPLSALKEFGRDEREAVASDLSEQGLRLFTELDLPDGALLVLKFIVAGVDGVLPGESSRAMELRAEVRHASPGLVKKSFVVGVHFIGLSDADRAFINGAIRA